MLVLAVVSRIALAARSSELEASMVTQLPELPEVPELPDLGYQRENS